MSIKITIPSFLQSFTNDTEVVEVDGNTVGECLKHLVEQFPGIEKMLFTQNGKLLSYVGIYINGEDVYPEELAKPIKASDDFYILYIIGGG
ncbi:MoaD/ThiS family protein [Chloroflexota bacterium]